MWFLLLSSNMGTMALQISSFSCILQRQFCYSASATTTAAAAVAPAPTTARTATAPTTRAREGPLSTAPDARSSLANLLVDSLEFSEQQAISTSTQLIKLRQSRGAKLCRPNFYKNADSVITLLQEKGLEKPHIKKLISSLPMILTCKIEQNLEPKMNDFLELGFSVSDFVDVILVQPEILYVGFNSNVRPAIEALREILGSNENVVLVLKRLRFELRAIRLYLVRNVSFLRARGIPLETIQKRILLNVSPFVRRHEVFKDKVAQVEVKWGVSPRSAMYLAAVHVLCCLNERNIESKCRVFESFGWDRSHVVHLFRLNPNCFGVGARNIKAKLSFYMNELGCDPGRIVAYHSLLSYSLEKKVMPRHLILQVLKEKGLIRRKRSFPVALSLCEDKFLGKFVIPFLDVVPDLQDMYVNSIKAATKEETTLVSQE